MSTPRNRDILYNAQYIAWQNCANGLLFIKNGFTGSEGQRYYTAVAVRIRTDVNFKQKHGEGTDMSFIPQTEENRQDAQAAAKFSIGLLMVTILGLVIWLTTLS